MLVLIKSKVQPNTGQFWLSYHLHSMQCLLKTLVGTILVHPINISGQYVQPEIRLPGLNVSSPWLKCLDQIKHRREIFLADKAIFNLNQVSICSGSNLEIIEASKDFAFGSKLGTFASAPLLQNHIFIINILVITIPLQQRSLCYMVASGRTIPGARVFRCKWLWWWSTKFSPWRLKIVLQHSSMVTFDRMAVSQNQMLTLYLQN